jgi:hypothetical protein
LDEIYLHFTILEKDLFEVEVDIARRE